MCIPAWHIFRDNLDASSVCALVCMLCIQCSLLISTETRHWHLCIFSLFSWLQTDAPTQSLLQQRRLLSCYSPLSGFVLWGPWEGVIPQMNFFSHLSSPLKNLFVCSRQPHSCLCSADPCYIPLHLIFNVMCFNFEIWCKSDGYWS